VRTGGTPLELVKSIATNHSTAFSFRNRVEGLARVYTKVH